MVRLGKSGVSDVVVIAFMFILLVLSIPFLFGYTSRGLDSAAERRAELKLNHLQRTLEEAEVRPGISALEAAAEQLVVKNPTVEENYLRNWMENNLDFLRPTGYEAKLSLSINGKSWKMTLPDNVTTSKDFLSNSTLAITKTNGKVKVVNVRLGIFEISE